MPAQYLSTSRLANVIQLITLGRQTGILRVVRGHGATREMGQIQFVDGQPTAALLGQLTGAAAMNVLSNWGESAYAFEDAQVADDGSLELADETVDAGYGRWPSGDSGWSGRPSPPPPSPGSMPSLPSSASWPQYGPASSPSYPARPSTAPSMPLSNYGHTGALPGGNGGPGGTGSSYPSGPQPGVPGPAVGAQSLMPRRTSRVDLSDPLPLDRRERMVLLLVDGRRSVTDLARLTRRSEAEVKAVLGNLKMLGLIE
jgi:Domain of unknown function (DUF4388)